MWQVQKEPVGTDKRAFLMLEVYMYLGVPHSLQIDMQLKLNSRNPPPAVGEALYNEVHHRLVHVWSISRKHEPLGQTGGHVYFFGRSTRASPEDVHK